VRYLNRYHVPRHGLPSLEFTGAKIFETWVNQTQPDWDSLISDVERSNKSSSEVSLDGLSMMERLDVMLKTRMVTCEKCKDKEDRTSKANKHEWPGRPKMGGSPEEMYWCCCNESWQKAVGVMCMNLDQRVS